jgi:aminopeptidase YwaD
MRRFAVTALLLGLVGTIGAVAPAEEGDQLDPLASITAAEYLEHVKWLADDARGGRLTGTEDERISTQYIADRFAAWGLMAGGTDGSWFQYFKIPSRAQMGPNSALSIGDRALAAGTDFRPVGRAPEAEATGRLVFAGYGISDDKYDDYTGLDCRGAVVVAFRCSRHAMPPGVVLTVHPYFAPTALLQMQVSAAKKAGAVGLILLTNASQKDEVGIVAGGGRRARNASRNPIPFPVVIAKRAPFAAVLDKAGVDIATWEASTQANKVPSPRAELGVTGRVATQVVVKEFQGRNVIGVLPGVDPELQSQVVVIGAHADHVGRNEAGNARDGNNEIHNGADDNASGTAGLLEVAQAFATCAYRPKRTIVFCSFTGEELGLI